MYSACRIAQHIHIRVVTEVFRDKLQAQADVFCTRGILRAVAQEAIIRDNGLEAEVLRKEVA